MLSVNDKLGPKLVLTSDDFFVPNDRISNCLNKPRTHQTRNMSGRGIKGETMERGRWTQMQLHTRGKDMGKQKASFILKLKTKNRSRQNGGKRQSSNQKQQGKVATKRQDKVQRKRQSSNQTWKAQNQNLP